MSKQNKYWFKRRRYGWGWTPVTWQGWLTLGFFIVIIINAALQLPPKPEQPTTSEQLRFLGVFFGAIIVLISISYAKGPNPRWRWGKKSSDNPEEDF